MEKELIVGKRYKFNNKKVFYCGKAINYSKERAIIEFIDIISPGWNRESSQSKWLPINYKSKGIDFYYLIPYERLSELPDEDYSTEFTLPEKWIIEITMEKKEVLVLGKYHIGDVVVSLRNIGKYRKIGNMFKVLPRSQNNALYYLDDTSSMNVDEWRAATKEETQAYHEGITNINDMKSECEFIIGKWYKYDESDINYLKFTSLDSKGNVHFSEAINEGDYKSDAAYWIKKNLTEVSLEEIQQWLPDGNPNKITPVILETNSIQKLLDEANRKYPIGTEYKPMFDNGSLFSSIQKAEYNARAILGTGIEVGPGYVYLFNTKQWTEVIKEKVKIIETANTNYPLGTKFIVTKEYGQFKIGDIVEYYEESITSKKGHCRKLTGNYSDVLNFPESDHPEVKLYEELESNSNNYQFKKGDLVEVTEKILETDWYHKKEVVGHRFTLNLSYDIIKKLNSGEKLVYDMTNKYSINYSKDHLKLVKEASIKESIDLSNTKIWIGHNPDLCRKVQEKAFELGYKWSNYKNIDYLNSYALFFDSRTNISIITNNDMDFFNKYRYKEITPEQLGIFQQNIQIEPIYSKIELITYPILESETFKIHSLHKEEDIEKLKVNIINKNNKNKLITIKFN